MNEFACIKIVYYVLISEKFKERDIHLFYTLLYIISKVRSKKIRDTKPNPISNHSTFVLPKYWVIDFIGFWKRP